jgi:hypothetical protein
MSPDVAVIEKTAARVMTSHLLVVSGWVIPSGRFAVFRTYRQVDSRPRIVGAVAADAVVVGLVGAAIRDLGMTSG